MTKPSEAIARPMTLDEIIAAIGELRDRFPEPPVASLAMHPETWAKLAALIECTEEQPRFRCSAVRINYTIPKDFVIPLDADGKPIMRPRKTPLAGGGRDG